MRASSFPRFESFVYATWFCLLAIVAASRGEEIPKISAFAPSKDLLQQIDFFMGRVNDSLSDPRDFDLAKQSRTLKDGHTLAALALVFAVHDEEHALKAAMPGMLLAAQRLAAADDNYEQAHKAFQHIKAARAGTVEPGVQVKWEASASLSALMKQVPLIHTGLKRGVEPNRLQRQAAQSAGQAAALAAIAQASWLDTGHLAKPEDVDKWRECCAQMRDAAGEVNSAVHAGDSARVAAGMQRLSRSCDTCHERFRGQ